MSVPDFGIGGGGIFKGLVLCDDSVIRDIHILYIFPLTQIYTTFSLLHPLSFALIPFLELLY